MIEVRDLSKMYSGVKVLDIPSLIIPKGESFGLVGNNGAGKTTFFRLVLDLIRADSGEVLSRGVKVAGSEEWKQYTGSYLDESFLIDFLTPEEYFEFIADIHRMTKGDIREFMERYDDFFDQQVLGKKKYIRDFSSGNQQKVGIAAALMAKPALLVLDEPFNNLDPSSQIRLKLLLKEMQKDGQVTMLISSHDLNHITEVCGRIVILDKGKVIRDIHKTADTLKQLEEYFYTQIYKKS